MEMPHNREYLEHLLRRFPDLSPVASAEGHLGNLLSRTEAVINRTPSESTLPHAFVDATTEVRLQIEAWLSGVFVDRKVCRSSEGQRDAAQAEAVLAVSSQTAAVPVGDRHYIFVIV